MKLGGNRLLSGVDNLLEEMQIERIWALVVTGKRQRVLGNQKLSIQAQPFCLCIENKCFEKNLNESRWIIDLQSKLKA